MKDLNLIRFVIGIVATLIIFIFSLTRATDVRKEFTTKFIARSGVFAAISIILYLIPIFNINIPIFPEFLKFHFDEIPVFIAGFAYGPWSAVFIIVVKTLVKLPLTSTLGVGELADLIYSIAFIVPAAIVYRKKKKFKGAMLGFAIGCLCQIVVSSFVTTFAMMNFYMFVMGWNEQFILSACQKVNPAIKDLKWSFLLLVGLPFNALKDVIVMIFTIPLYKGMHKLIDRLSAQKN